MKKINNKGFVISSILYTLLISFLLMLALLLLQFKSSSDVINNASKDLVNGEEFKATQLLDNSYVSFTDSSGNLVTLDGDEIAYYYTDNGHSGQKKPINNTGLKYKCVANEFNPIENIVYINDEPAINNIRIGENTITEIVGYKYYWYEPPNKMLVRINSRYGTVYWPKDFYPSDSEATIISTDGITINDFQGTTSKTYKNINVNVESTADGNLTLKITDNNNLGLGLVNGSKCDGAPAEDPNNCIVLSKPSTGCE